MPPLPFPPDQRLIKKVLGVEFARPDRCSRRRDATLGIEIFFLAIPIMKGVPLATLCSSAAEIYAPLFAAAFSVGVSDERVWTQVL